MAKIYVIIYMILNTSLTLRTAVGSILENTPAFCVQSWVLRSRSLEKFWTLQGNRGLPILKSKHGLIQCLMLLI